MLSNLSKRFLAQILEGKNNLRKIVSMFSYSERITVAIDIHVIQERLLEDIKDFVDEKELARLIDIDKEKL